MGADGSQALVARLEAPAAALRAAIARARTILVASEPLPDGDAFGAMLALRSMIESAFGLSSREEAKPGEGPKHVALLSERGSPHRYSYLEGASLSRAPSPEDEDGFDLGILVDGGVERCGSAVRAIFERCREKACVDHHRAGSRASYDTLVLDPERAATTELLATLLETEAWRGVPLSRGLAEALYTGIVADTGGFVYSLTTPWTHRVAARLLEAGARANMIGERVLLDVSKEDLTLQARVVSRLASEHGGALALGVLTRDMLDGREPALVGYDRIVTPIAFIESTRATALLREMGTGVWKVSFRSRAGVDVAKVARELDPEGGGHARAAGCTLLCSLEDARARVVAAIGRALDAARP